jgi:hypothetical protein
MMKCKECKFAEIVSDPMNIGSMAIYCHFNPPIPVLSMQGRNQALAGIWPPVAPDSWCSHGELKLNIS